MSLEVSLGSDAFQHERMVLPLPGGEGWGEGERLFRLHTYDLRIWSFFPVSIPLTVYLAAVVGAWLTVVATVPLWRKLCRHLGLVDDPGHRKLHDQPVPLAGGLAVMTGLLVPTSLAALFLWWQSSNEPFSPLDPQSAYLLQYGLSQRAVELAAIFIGAFGMLILGLLDDKHELRPRAKFAGQVLIA